MTTQTAILLRTPKSRRSERLSRLIERALEQALPAPVGPLRELHEAMRYGVLAGGKRFRPLLCLGACEASGAPVRRALRAACAVELIHAYSLIHDDLPAMDNAEERRGRPSCHRQFGEGPAILVGDALLTLAFELLGGDGTPNSLRIIRTLGEACGSAGLIGGQALDLGAAQRPAATSEDAWREIARRKTAALITASVLAGGLAGGAPAASLRRLRRYGQAIGFAFQLIDDAHDGDGLATRLGVDQARGQARRLIAAALQALDGFGARAATLRELAAWLNATAN